MFFPRTDLARLRKECPINLKDIEPYFRYFEVVMWGDTFIDVSNALLYLSNGLNNLYNKFKKLNLRKYDENRIDKELFDRNVTIYLAMIDKKIGDSVINSKTLNIRPADIENAKRYLWRVYLTLGINPLWSANYEYFEKKSEGLIESSFEDYLKILYEYSSESINVMLNESGIMISNEGRTTSKIEKIPTVRQNVERDRNMGKVFDYAMRKEREELTNLARAILSSTGYKVIPASKIKKVEKVVTGKDGKQKVVKREEIIEEKELENEDLEEQAEENPNDEEELNMPEMEVNDDESNDESEEI